MLTKLTAVHESLKPFLNLPYAPMHDWIMALVMVIMEIFEFVNTTEYSLSIKCHSYDS